MIRLRLSILWQWKDFIFSNIRREVLDKYAGASLGALWNLIQPIMQILVYTLIFSGIMRSRLPGTTDALAYSVYLCAGLLPWQLFAEVSNRGTGMFIEFAPYLKKSGFPRLCVPATVIGTALVNFAIIGAIFLVFLMVSGRLPTMLALLSAIPVLAVLLLFAAGIAIWLGTLNVFLRDVGQVFGILLQFWFWLTPIVWAEQAIPPHVSQWLVLNPLYGPMSALHGIFLESAMPDWFTLLPALGVGILSLTLAWVTFRTYSPQLADEI